MLKKCFVATCTSPTATSASGALLTSMWGKSCNLSDVTTDPDQLVTLFVDQQLALGTLEALTSQAPDTIMAVCTKSSLKKRQEIRQFWRQLMVVCIIHKETSIQGEGANCLCSCQSTFDKLFWRGWVNVTSFFSTSDWYQRWTWNKYPVYDKLSPCFFHLGKTSNKTQVAIYCKTVLTTKLQFLSVT